MNTRNEALIAALLYSSLVRTRAAYLGGGGARFLTAGGERLMRYWWRVLYSFALRV